MKCVSVRILKAPGQTRWVRDQLGVQQNISCLIFSSAEILLTTEILLLFSLALQSEPREKDMGDKKQGLNVLERAVFCLDSDREKISKLKNPE